MRILDVRPSLPAPLRVRLVKALSARHARHLAPFFREMLKDSDAAVRMAAGAALQALA